MSSLVAQLAHHDREIRIDNGWVIKIWPGVWISSRSPGGWFEVGANDPELAQSALKRGGYLPSVNRQVRESEQPPLPAESPARAAPFRPIDPPAQLWPQQSNPAD